MTEFDLIIIGGGPAGVAAAAAAASAGLEVALFDENPAGADPSNRAAVPGLTSFLAHAVWGVADGYRIDAVGPHGPITCSARALIVASGATLRIVPFEGWTLPGVIDLVTAVKQAGASGSLAGGSTLVAGCGPWLAPVAAKTIEDGGKVDALVDLAGAADWARALSALAGLPDILMQRLRWWRTIRRAGTPRYARSSIVRVEPAGGRLRATLARCDADGRAIDTPFTTVLADRIVVGHGFMPATDITGLLRARHRYSRTAGGWIACADAEGRTSRALLYVTGAAAGIGAGDAAADHGTLVGLACALDLTHADSARLTGRIAAARGRYRRRAVFARATANLVALRSGQVLGMTPETIVCRCEEVRRAEIDAACDSGAHDMNQLKAWTRCGMGLCQGRLCGDIAGELLMHRVGAASRETVGRFTARTPLRPVMLEALTGDFDYSDIAIPQAAPL